MQFISVNKSGKMGGGRLLVLLLCFFQFHGNYAQLCIEDVAVNEKLHDQKFIERQLNCILSNNDNLCDQFGIQMKRLAPDVFRGNCIKPCTKCTQKQIRKVIVLLQQNYPKEFAAVLHKFRQIRG